MSGAVRRKILLSTLFFITVFITSLFLGRYRISPLKIGSFIKQMLFTSGNTTLPGNDWHVFYYIRLPRIILVSGVGVALSLSGAAYQSIFRNPLVSPGILGVTAGAGFGVALGILLSPEYLFIIYCLAFLGGIIAVIMTYGIFILGRGSDIIIMVLGGIVVSSLFNALISILKYVADPYNKLPGIVFWLMGGFSRTGWNEVYFALPFIAAGTAVLLILRWNYNIISMGSEEATSLGINVRAIRLLTILVSTLMVASSVATAGQVTWIGLVVPHIARYLVGADHRVMLPVAAMLGPGLLLIMDNLARTVSGAEIPISIITALVGAPFFAFLILKQRESGWS